MYNLYLVYRNHYPHIHEVSKLQCTI